MAHEPPGTLTQTFLLDGEPDLPTLRAIRGSDDDARKKRSHRKSRWGCTACKRRKVKCDENAPCSHCEKRREPCSLVEAASASKPLTPAASPPHELGPLADAEARVNLMHMELFHHFTQVTIDTLVFENTWSELVQLAFHEEYLMTAILAVAARHLSILNPSSRRYSDAALILLSKSCSQFRADLDGAITVANRDTRLGTSILLHYLSWSDVSFLSPPADGRPLDLSGDQLFLLSGGVRYVRLLSWQLPGLEVSIFGRLMATRNCSLLRSMVEPPGRGFHAMRGRMMGLYDDPRLRGGLATPPPEEAPCAEHPGAILAPCPQPCAHSYISSLLALRFPEGVEKTPAERALYSRFSFEVAVDRLMLLLYAARIHELDASALGPEIMNEVERCVLAFPVLCFGPFCEMVAAGDARALAVLFLMYKCSRAVLGGEGCPWWAETRMAVMEEALRGELIRRGLLGAVEEVAWKAVQDMETGAGD